MLRQNALFLAPHTLFHNIKGFGLQPKFLSNVGLGLGL